MEHYDETISKFLEALNVDSIKDVRYQGKIFTYQRCICGQRIQTCYIFRNQKNKKQCFAGKKCLKHIAYYLGWE